MSGARLALTAAIEMQNQGLKRSIATMCIGVGQGIALMMEAV
jgi:acetyl-CoA C-acetyltransferase/acetyl-CoA acyltransferase